MAGGGADRSQLRHAERALALAVVPIEHPQRQGVRVVQVLDLPGGGGSGPSARTPRRHRRRRALWRHRHETGSTTTTHHSQQQLVSLLSLCCRHIRVLVASAAPSPAIAAAVAACAAEPTSHLLRWGRLILVVVIHVGEGDRLGGRAWRWPRAAPRLTSTTPPSLVAARGRARGPVRAGAASPPSRR